MKKSPILLIGLLLIAFTTADIRSMYKAPREAASICVADIDLDGDNDIVIGHNYSFQTEWSGVSILKNEDNGSFLLSDSIFVFGGGGIIYSETINMDSLPDIIGLHSDEGLIYAAVLYFDSGVYDVNYYLMGQKINKFSIGDINNDITNDIVFISNNDQYWGVLSNDGSGNFTSPEYYNLEYYPQDIATGDLNNDGTDDIIIGGSTEIYFSKDTGFHNLQLDEHTSRVHVADFDNDGDNDIIGLLDLLGAETDIMIFENTGLETFIAHNIDHYLPGSTSSAVADFNNDTLPDLMILPASNDGVYILYNTNGFEYLEPEFIEVLNNGEAYRRATTADVDGNGFNDIVIVRRASPNAATFHNVIILFNDGEGNFVDEPLGFAENRADENKLKNYPNPFNTETTFEFFINKTSHIVLSVYSFQGNLVKSLTNQKMKGGEYQIKWGGLNNAGQACEPGVYFAVLKGDRIITKTTKILKY